MRARFFTEPTAGPPSPAGFIRSLRQLELTERIIRPPIIHSRIDRDKWSWGVSSSGDIRYTLADPEGLFSPSTNPRSAFNYAGMKGSLSYIIYGDTPTADPDDVTSGLRQIVWLGYLTEKDIESRPRDGVSTILARAADVALREASFPATAVSDGASIVGILRAIFRQGEISQQMGRLTFGGLQANGSLVGDPTEDGIVVPQIADLFPDGPDFTRALSVVQDILQVTDNVMRFAPDISSIPTLGGTQIFQRGSLPSVGTIRDVISIDSHTEGTEQLYNRVIVSTGVPAPDHVAQVDNLASQRKYGLRTTRVNGRWLRNASSARAIANSLLNRLSRPRRQLVVTTDPWALGRVRNMALGNSVTLAIPPSTAAGGRRHGEGTARSAGRYPRVRYQGYRGAWWIEQLRWNPDQDTVQIYLRER